MHTHITPPPHTHMHDPDNRVAPHITTRPHTSQHGPTPTFRMKNETRLPPVEHVFASARATSVFPVPATARRGSHDTATGRR